MSLTPAGISLVKSSISEGNLRAVVQEVSTAQAALFVDVKLSSGDVIKGCCITYRDCSVELVLKDDLNPLQAIGIDKLSSDFPRVNLLRSDGASVLLLRSRNLSLIEDGSLRQEAQFPLSVRHYSARTIDGVILCAELSVGGEQRAYLERLHRGGLDLFPCEFNHFDCEGDEVSRRIFLLSHLQKNPGQYGLQILENTGLQQGTVYGTLKRLQDEKYIRSELVARSDQKGPKIRVYYIIEKGSAYIASLQRYFKNL